MLQILYQNYETATAIAIAVFAQKVQLQLQLQRIAVAVAVFVQKVQLQLQQQLQYVKTGCKQVPPKGHPSNDFKNASKKTKKYFEIYR